MDPDTLYIQLSREIGRHFLISVARPFFGISLIIAVLKLRVRRPFAKTHLAYFYKGSRKNSQYRFINFELIPSIPAADLQLAPSRAMSSSSLEIS
jgi:hypothetical protein